MPEVADFCHELLRGKILYITLAGFLLLPLVSLGFSWVIDDPNRNRKRRGVALVAIALSLSYLFIWYGLFG